MITLRHYSSVFLLFISLTLNARSKDPFQLPASIPVPAWVQEADWSHPNVRAIQSLIEDYKRSAHSRDSRLEKEQEDPYETAFIRWCNQMSMLNAIQPDGSVRIDGKAFRSTLQKNLNEASVHRTSRSVSFGNWSVLGPIESFLDNNEGKGFSQSNVYTLAIAPSNTSILYCGTENGSLFRSNDKGLNWFSISDALLAQAVQSIAVDPGDPDVVYVKLYDGILKSSDGGTTWNLLSTFTGGSGEKIIILPATGRILVIGQTNVYGSDDAGATWFASNGISSVQQMYDVEAKAGSSDTVFATGETAARTLKLFTSVDGGVTFTDVTGINAAVENTGTRFGVSPANSSVVYCCALGNTSPPHLLKSTDGGFTWSVIVAATGTGLGGSATTVGLGMSNGQGYYDFDIMVDPADVNNVIVATTSSYKSTDGGFNFSPLGGYAGGPIRMHVDIQCMRAVGTDSYISSDGGVISSTDFFSSNSNVTVINKGITGSLYWGFGQGWQEDITTGGRYHNGNDAMFSDNYGSGNSLNIGGGESGTGHVFYGRERTVGHNDMGVSKIPQTFADPILYNVRPNIYWPQVDYYYKFHGKLVIHPWYRDVFYVGVDSILWRSNNSGSSYSAVKNFGNGDQVWRFEISRSNTNVMYVLTRNGIHKTTDNGLTWTTLNLPAAYQYYNADVAVNPTDENEVYISMANGGPNDKMFKSTDGGTTWLNYTGTLLSGKYVYCTLFHGGTNGGVYAATQDNPSKMFYRDNTMSDWIDFSSGLVPNHQATAYPMIFYRDHKLRLPGLRGIMESPLYATGLPVAQAMCNREYLGCEKDTVEFYDYSMLNYTGATWQWSFPGASWISSTSARNPKVLYTAPGNYDVTLTVTDSSGQSDTRTFANMIQFPNSYCSPDTVIGNCMTMSASNRTIDIGSVNINSNTFSISTWVKPNGIQRSFGQIIGHPRCPGSPNYGLGIGITFSGYTPNLQLCYTDDQVNYSNYSGLFLDSTRWNNVVLTYSPTGVILYLNGIPANVNTNAMPALDLSQGPFQLNPDIHNQGGIFDGLIDEVKIYDYTLSQNEVREKMHLIQSDPSAESGLVKYIQFNKLEAGSSSIYDVLNGNRIQTVQNSIVTSTAPVSTGSVYRNPSVNASGLHRFPDADLDMYLSSGGTYPDGEMVAFHLRNDPDRNPDTRPIVPGYFILNNYGSNLSFTSPDSLIFSGIKNTNPSDEAGEYLLFNRNSFSFGNTWNNQGSLASGFNFVDSVNSNLSWQSPVNFTTGGQYVIVKDSSLFTTLHPLPPENRSFVSLIYPNPVSHSFFIDINSLRENTAQILVFDAKGSRVISTNQKIVKGKNILMVPLPELSEGMYNVTVMLKDDIHANRKMMVK